MDLPFGLILKWSDRTRIEEGIAMQMARAAGMPVPNTHQDGGSAVLRTKLKCRPIHTCESAGSGYTIPGFACKRQQYGLHAVPPLYMTIF